MFLIYGMSFSIMRSPADTNLFWILSATLSVHMETGIFHTFCQNAEYMFPTEKFWKAIIGTEDAAAGKWFFWMK